MTKAIVTQNDNQSIVIAPDNPIASAIEIVTYNLSDTSKRQYALTFKKWLAFCEANNLPTVAMNANNIIHFLESDNLAHRTKQARLSHLRKLLEALHAQQPDNVAIESLYKQVQLLKVKRSEADKQVTENSRTKNALTKENVFTALHYYGDDTRLHTRNRAMLAILFYCGLRRAELTALIWDDIDLENMLITIRHGKGDKERTIPMLGGAKYIQDWQAMSAGRTFIFCGIRKGDKFRDDKPVATNAVWRVLKPLETELNIEGLSPHDARRTIITDLLNNGASVADVQFIAGHANPQTTLGYAQVKDAKEVAGRVAKNLSY